MNQDSLIPAMRKKTEPYNNHQTTQLSNISEYTTDIRRIAGKDNVVADTLSHAPVEDGPTLSPTLDIPNVSSTTSATAVGGVDFDEIVREQQNDELLKAIQNDPSTGLRLVEVPQGDLTHSLNRETTPFRPGGVRATH